LYSQLQMCLSSSSPDSDIDILSLTRWATYATPRIVYDQSTLSSDTYPSTASPDAPELALFSNPYVITPWQCLSLDTYLQQQPQQQSPQSPPQLQSPQPQYQFFASNKFDLINWQIEATSVFVWFALVYVLLNIMLVAIQAAIDRLRVRRLILRAEYLSQRRQAMNET